MGVVRNLSMATVDTDAPVGPAAAAGGHEMVPAGRTWCRAGLEACVVVAGSFAFAAFLPRPLVPPLGTSIYRPPGDSTSAIYYLWSLTHGDGFHILGVNHVITTGAAFGWDQGNGVNVQQLWYDFPAYLSAVVVGEIAA